LHITHFLQHTDNICADSQIKLVSNQTDLFFLTNTYRLFSQLYLHKLFI